MTLKELHKRLGEIISQNDERGWSERNDLPMVVAINPLPRFKGQHYKNAKRFPIKYASSAQCGMEGHNPFMELVAEQSAEMK